MASTHLAFDLGAGSGRAVLGTLAGGLLHVDEVHRFRRPLREHGERLTIPRRELYDVTGIQFMEANTLYQVLADRILEPELTGRTATRLMIADYFLHRFGGRAVAERTIAFRANFTNEAGAAGTVRFLRNLTGLWVLQECRRAWRASGTAAVDFDDPCFAQRSDDMPDRIRRYCRDRALPEPHTRGTVRLILESLTQAYRRTLRTLERLVGQRLPVLHIVGGGARNELLCRTTADACACTVVAGPAEATAIGNLLVQASAVGTLPAGAAIRDVVRASVALATYPPNVAQ